MATKVEAARLLVEQAAAKYDRGERCDMEAGMAKLFASEARSRMPQKRCAFTEVMDTPKSLT